MLAKGSVIGWILTSLILILGGLLHRCRRRYSSGKRNDKRVPLVDLTPYFNTPGVILISTIYD